jgi:hypothetical protein
MTNAAKSNAVLPAFPEPDRAKPEGSASYGKISRFQVKSVSIIALPLSMRHMKTVHRGGRFAG